MKKLLTLSIILLSSSCSIINVNGKSIEKIKGDGNIQIKNIEIKDFDHLEVNGSLIVDHKLGEINSLKIETDKNIINYVKVEYKEGKLKLFTEKDKKFKPTNHKNKIKLTLVSSVFESVSSSRGADININDNFSVNKFYAKTSSSGDISISDLIVKESISFKTSSSGDIKIKNINGKNIDCSASSSGDIKIEIIECENITNKTSSSGDIKIKNINGKNIDCSASSSGDIKIETISCKEIKSSSSSSGDVIINLLEGDLDKLEVSSSSSGNFNIVGKGSIKTAKLKTISSGDIRIKGINIGGNMKCIL